MRLKRTILVILAFLMLLSPVNIIYSNAAPSYNIELSTYKWDSALQRNVEADSFESGDTLTVCVSAPSSIPLGGLQFEINYDSEQLKFNASNSKYLISDSKANLMLNTPSDGKISAVFDTSARDNAVSGDLFNFNFTVLDIKETKSSVISMRVVAAYDSTASHETLNIAAVGDASISLNAVSIPESFIELVKKLENITVDSLEDIVNAETAFAALSTQEKQVFKTNKWFDTFNTARSRYNLLLENAALEELKQAAAAFVKANKILNKDIEDLTTADAEAVEKMISAYGLLTENVKTKLSKEIREKIPLMEARVDELILAEENTAAFKESYATLWETDEDIILLDAEDAITLVNEALLIYDTLDDISKQTLSDKKAYLDTLKAKLDKQIAANAESAAIEEEVVAYQKVWIKVLSLSKFSASLKDKTALELAITEYGKLSQGAQERLAFKYNNMLELLELIEYYENISDDGEEDDGKDTSSEQSSSSDTSSENQSSSSEANSGVQSGTVSDSGTPSGSTDSAVSYITNTVTNTVIQTVPETVTETVNTETVVKEYMQKPVAKIIFWLFITIAVSCAWAAFAYFYNKFLEKKLIPAAESEEE